MSEKTKLPRDHQWAITSRILQISLNIGMKISSIPIMLLLIVEINKCGLALPSHFKNSSKAAENCVDRKTERKIVYCGRKISSIGLQSKGSIARLSVQTGATLWGYQEVEGVICLVFFYQTRSNSLPHNYLG